MTRAWSIVMKGVMDHCDYRDHGACDDKVHGAL